MGLAPQILVPDTFVKEQIQSERYTGCLRNHTFGSTGKPKGVVHDHASVVSSALQHASAMGIDGNTHAVQFGIYTFIISTF